MLSEQALLEILRDWSFWDEKALQHFYEHFPQASEAIFITRKNAEAFLTGAINPVID